MQRMNQERKSNMTDIKETKEIRKKAEEAARQYASVNRRRKKYTGWYFVKSY
jgi:hypothetical protein